ncbi:ParB/RepB/Spo0J family partition protein [Litorivivens sp.]|uniref:ParB/RepB/Spo0J family partition protein n=1 Tax=Litorivivens sp. TaxID=2020868 RepID=UPI003564C7F5
MTTKKPGPYADLDAITGDIGDSASEKKPDKPTRTSVRQNKVSPPVAARVITKGEAPGSKSSNLIERLKASADSIEKTMPVTGVKVRLRLQEIDTELVDVSPENERDQDLLDESSVSDILPSFIKNGQQQPGTLRPKGEGRFELIEGSRRLFCAKLTRRKYLALVGDIPDADVRVLSRTENVHKPPSAFERARAYQRDIESGLFKTWEQLAAAEGITKSTLSRYKALIEVDRAFVKAFPDPNSFSSKNAEWIRKTQNTDERVAKALLDAARELAKLKAAASEKGIDPPTAEEVMTRLRKVARESQNQGGPTPKKPVVYKTPDGRRQVKHSIARDGKSVKLELKGLSEAALKEVVEQVKRIAGVN